MTTEPNLSSADDQKLVKSAKDGDMAAYEELVARHRDKNFRAGL